MTGLEQWSVRRFRDLVVMSGERSDIVIACDSVGGIGAKPGDSFAASAEVVTHFAARVPLLEVIAAGARPQVIVDTLSVEKDPAAIPMIAEIRRLAAELGIDPEEGVTGSTEDNVPTAATGLGVTIIGTAPRGGLRLGRSLAGDVVACLGLPLSAPEDVLRPGDPRMPTLAEALRASDLPATHEMLPVGSRGVAYEAAQLAGSSGLLARMRATPGLDPLRTAGPSTCVLLSLREVDLPELRRIRPDLPVTVVADLYDSNEQ